MPRVFHSEMCRDTEFSVIPVICPRVSCETRSSIWSSTLSPRRSAKSSKPIASRGEVLLVEASQKRCVRPASRDSRMSCTFFRRPGWRSAIALKVSASHASTLQASTATTDEVCLLPGSKTGTSTVSPGTPNRSTTSWPLLLNCDLLMRPSSSSSTCLIASSSE